MSESLNSFINLDSTKSLRWEMTQYSEQLFSNYDCPQIAGGVVADARAILYPLERGPRRGCHGGLAAARASLNRALRCLPSLCVSVFRAFLTW